MSRLYLALLAAMVTVRCFADAIAMNQLPESEVAAVKAFLREFTDALNSNDADRIKRMSGGAWKHFRDKINCKEKTECFDIVKISTDGVTNIITRAHVVDKNGEPYSVEVVYDLKKVDGVYSIDKMRLPESERRRAEYDIADGNFEKLISAIKNKDMSMVRLALPFGDVADFDAELSVRGLSWIKDAVNSDVHISGGWGVRRSGNEGFVGHVEISSMPDGTKVLHEVIFKGMKIDRAAPRRETKEEFFKRVAAEKEAARKKHEEQRAAEENEFEEQLKKRFGPKNKASTK